MAVIPSTLAMDVEAGGDEKKPLSALEDPNDEDNQPDPDEILSLDAGGGKIWLVKVS